MSWFESCRTYFVICKVIKNYMRILEINIQNFRKLFWRVRVRVCRSSSIWISTDRWSERFRRKSTDSNWTNAKTWYPRKVCRLARTLQKWSGKKVPRRPNRQESARSRPRCNISRREQKFRPSGCPSFRSFLWWRTEWNIALRNKAPTKEARRSCEVWTF